MQCLIQFNDVERENYIHNLNSFLLKREQEKSLVAINLRLWNNKDNVETKNLNQNILEVYKEKAKTSKNIHISEADEFIWPSLDHSYNTNLTRCLGGKKQFAILMMDRFVCAVSIIKEALKLAIYLLMIFLHCYKIVTI